MTRSVSNLGATIGGAVLGLTVAAALLAPLVTTHAPDARFEMLNAPPTAIHLVGADGRLHAPFIHPWIRVNQLEQQYETDRSRQVRLAWFSGGHLVESSDEARTPFLLLGTDSFGGDVFSRLIFGARISLGLSISAALLAAVLGAVIGALAGYVGGLADVLLMRTVEFVVVLPVMYVVLALRAVMPLVLSPSQVFLILLAIFAISGAPAVAKGVRAIVRVERELDYAAAAASLGASHMRLLLRHLLPSARSFLLIQLTLLIPAFIVAEATISFVGLGFPDPVPSWGTMLHEASNLRALADFPWLLSPAVAMFLVVLAVNLLLQRGSAQSLVGARFTAIQT